MLAIPVPGGWSEWASWKRCNKEDSKIGTDECLCSMRQCNNPAPQNGGTECQGVNIKVDKSIFLINFSHTAFSKKKKKKNSKLDFGICYLFEWQHWQQYRVAIQRCPGGI